MSEPWHKVLSNRIKTDEALAEQLREVFAPSTFKEFRAGTPRLLAKLHRKTRAKLYHFTGIDELRFDGYESYVGLEKQGVPEVGGYSGKREVGLDVPDNEIGTRRSTRDVQTIFAESPSKRYSKENNLDSIALGLDLLKRSVESLGASYEQTAKDRVNAVRYSLRTLYDQMTYFARESTSDKERVALAKSIDPVSFGLIWNVMDGILKDPKSPEVFARAAISHGFGRPE